MSGQRAFVISLLLLLFGFSMFFSLDPAELFLLLIVSPKEGFLVRVGVDLFLFGMVLEDNEFAVFHFGESVIF